MASLGWIGLGMTSVAGRGVGKQSGDMSLAAMAAKKEQLDKASKRKVPFKLSYEEVKHIRSLDEQGVKRRKIFEDHVEGKMTYESMVGILNYLTRVWQ